MTSRINCTGSNRPYCRWRSRFTSPTPGFVPHSIPPAPPSFPPVDAAPDTPAPEPAPVPPPPTTIDEALEPVEKEIEERTEPLLTTCLRAVNNLVSIGETEVALELLTDLQRSLLAQLMKVNEAQNNVLASIPVESVDPN